MRDDSWKDLSILKNPDRSLWRKYKASDAINSAVVLIADRTGYQYSPSGYLLVPNDSKYRAEPQVFSFYEMPVGAVTYSDVFKRPPINRVWYLDEGMHYIPLIFKNELGLISL